MRNFLVGLLVGVFLSFAFIYIFSGPRGTRELFVIDRQRTHIQVARWAEQKGFIEFIGNMEPGMDGYKISHIRKMFPPWPITVIEAIK